MRSADQADPLSKPTTSDDFEAIDELVDEENRETSRRQRISTTESKSGVLSRFLGSSRSN